MHIHVEDNLDWEMIDVITIEMPLKIAAGTDKHLPEKNRFAKIQRLPK